MSSKIAIERSCCISYDPKTGFYTISERLINRDHILSGESDSYLHHHIDTREIWNPISIINPSMVLILYWIEIKTAKENKKDQDSKQKIIINFHPDQDRQNRLLTFERSLVVDS